MRKKSNTYLHNQKLKLAIPAMSAPSERIWSQGARVLTVK
jgi:hypothetical protein